MIKMMIKLKKIVTIFPSKSINLLEVDIPLKNK